MKAVGRGIAVHSRVIEAELHDDRFICYILAVWERELEEFRLGRASAPPSTTPCPSASDLVERSDAQRYVTVAQRRKRRLGR